MSLVGTIHCRTSGFSSGNFNATCYSMPGWGGSGLADLFTGTSHSNKLTFLEHINLHCGMIWFATWFRKCRPGLGTRKRNKVKPMWNWWPLFIRTWIVEYRFWGVPYLLCITYCISPTRLLRISLENPHILCHLSLYKLYKFSIVDMI